jgi:hypothetical protein
MPAAVAESDPHDSYLAFETHFVTARCGLFHDRAARAAHLTGAASRSGG